MNAPLPLSLMAPHRPSEGDSPVRADETDGYLQPAPPIVIPPQNSALKQPYKNGHDSGVDVDHPELFSNASGRGSVPSIHRPTSSGSVASFNSIHNPGLPVPPSGSPAVVSPQRFAPNFANGNRLVRQSPAPSLQSVNASTWGRQQSTQKLPNNSSGDIKPTAIPARLSGEMMKRPDSLLKSHDYEELPSSRLGPPNAIYSYTDANGNATPQPPPPQQSSSSDSTDFLCDTSHPSDRLRNIYRRRQNPLYESHGSDSPTPAKSKGLQGRQCPCAVTVVIALLAIAAFIMALLVITGTTTSRVYLVSRNHEKDLAKALVRIKAMENDYAALLSKFDDIQTNLTKEIEYNKNVSSMLEGATKQLHLLHSNSTWQQDMLSELNTKYDQSENVMTKLSERTDNLSSTVEGTTDLVGVLLSNRSQQQDILTQLRSQWESLSVKFVRQNDSLRALRLQFHDIDTQVEAMHNLPSGVDQLQKDVVKQTQKLAIVEGDWQRKFQRLADNVTSQVSMVSKMQGPPGVGNLTRCRYNKYSRGSAAAAVSDTTTAWIPQSQQEANEWVVMGVECTTKGGTGSYLNTTRVNDWNGLQYRCVCFGNGGQQVSRYCELHIWQCPRLS